MMPEKAFLMRKIGAHATQSRTVQLPEVARGSLGWVRNVSDSIRDAKPDVCIAFGGGSVIDAVKVAVAAQTQPWVLDEAVWRSSRGVLPLMPRRNANRSPVLVAITTSPGSSAQTSPRATIASRTGKCQQMILGPGLVPEVAIVDSTFWRDLGTTAKAESVCEMAFRSFGPYLVTQRCTPTQEQATLRMTDEMLSLGDEILRKNGSVSDSVRSRLDSLSMASVEAARTAGWLPSTHPWWCLQNSLAAELRMPKRALTAKGFAEVLKSAHRDPTSSGMCRPFETRFDELAEGARYTALGMLEFCGRVARRGGYSDLQLRDDSVQRVVASTYELWGTIMEKAGWGDRNTSAALLRAL